MAFQAKQLFMILSALIGLSEILAHLIVWRNSLQQALKHTQVYFSSAGGKNLVSCCFWTLTVDDVMLSLG